MVTYKSDEESKSISIEINEQLGLNLNLSTALFETLTISTTYINECMVKHGLKPDMKITSKMKKSLKNLESTKDSFDYGYSIENLTGEEIQVATRETDEYGTVYKGQVMMLDFSNKFEDFKPVNQNTDEKRNSKSIVNFRKSEQHEESIQEGKFQDPE